MEEESNDNGENSPCKESPVSPFGKNKNSRNNNNNHNKEQDRFLPIANVGRIMKKWIPGNGKISKDAKETVQECVSEFISFVTGEASDKCQREKRKTINGDDIIWAITTLGFEDYVVPLKLYLAKYRDIEDQEKLNTTTKQQHMDQNQQREHESVISPYTTSLYSTTSFMSHHHQQPPFVSSDQPFALTFSPSLIPKGLQQQDQINSISHW